MAILLRKPHVLVLLVLVLPFSGLLADRVNVQGGKYIDGTIDSVANGSLNIISAQGSYPIPLNSIVSVEMAAPADVDKAGTADAATVITLMEPLVAKFSGLPAPWMELAMYRLGCAYIDTMKLDPASTESISLVTLYPSSPTAKMYSDIIKARVSLKSGSPANAALALAPLLTDADAVSIPPTNLQPAYAELYLASGLVAEAQKKPAYALEQYLKVKVLLYRDTAAQPVADKLIDDLKKKFPYVSVE